MADTAVVTAMSRFDDMLWRRAAASENLGTLLDVVRRVQGGIPSEQIAVATVMAEDDARLASLMDGDQGQQPQTGGVGDGLEDAR